MKKKIAFFTTGWCSEILSQFINGMQKTLEKENVDIFLFLCYATYGDTEANKIGEMNIFKLPDMHDFSGAVIFGSGLGYDDQIDDIVNRCKEADVPVIIQGAKREGTYYVGSDNYTATLDMCDHLQNKHNCQDIIFFAGSQDSLDSELRLKAVKDYLKANNHLDVLRDVFYTKWENVAAARYINNLVNSGQPLPDVFICANDGLAMSTCLELSNHGFNVPDDTIVTGYDYIDDSQVFDPSIASVDQCFTKMGELAGEVWLELLEKKVSEKEHIIPCEFVPGDSCGCYQHRSSDKIRRFKGREAFSKKSMTTYFNRKLNLLDSTILSCITYSEFKERSKQLLTEDHDFEGNSFHILLEPNFGLSIYDQNIHLRTKGYSSYMEVLYSTQNGSNYNEEQFPSRQLIPCYDSDDKNHLYIFLPIHESDENYGYIIFRDCIDKVGNHFLQTYQSRMGLVFDKFRHALSLDLINKRLLEVMKKDPLTNVSNRIAFEDKSKVIQSEINADKEVEFAIAMFDVNNLKLINDSKGHDAGDEYLNRACRLICDTFKHSPVYRIGGDEFVSILMGDDYIDYENKLEAMNKQMSTYSCTLPIPDNYISIASGVAIYDPAIDKSVQNVVKRSDELMYINKARMKQ